jgi:hypothetical protein
MNSKLLAGLSVLLACSCVLFIRPSSAVSAAPINEDGYGYCTVIIGTSTERKQVVSSVLSVFRVKSGTYHVGVQNSFRDFVSANFDNVSSPTCYTTIESYQEAADDRNSWIGRLRQDRWTVFTVNWSYRGD